VGCTMWGMLSLTVLEGAWTTSARAFRKVEMMRDLKVPNAKHTFHLAPRHHCLSWSCMGERTLFTAATLRILRP